MTYQIVNGKLTKPDTHKRELWCMPPETPLNVIHIVRRLFAALPKYTSLLERTQALAFAMCADIACMGDQTREEFVGSLHNMIDEYIQKNRELNIAKGRI